MKLKKELNLLNVFCISTGAMLSGLFILPGLAYALAAIARIVEEPEFDKKWMEAKTTEALRDIVLLGKRKRHL